MKKLSIISVLALSICACNMVDIRTEQQDEPATVVVNVRSSALTRAEAYLDQQTYEKQVNNVQVLVFDEDGTLNAYKDAGTTVTNITLTSTTGLKHIWAVVNGPDVSGVAHLDELKAIEVGLDANSITASKGFLMVGSVDYTVSNSNAEAASVTVARLLSRVALRSVTHNAPKAYGDLKIVRAFIQNVVSNHTLGNGAAAELAWVNQMGMNAESVVINGTTSLASCPELTYAEIGSDVKMNEVYSPAIPDMFYCYPNVSSTYIANTTWSPRKTALTLAVQFTGVDQEIRYYTIALPDTQSGTLKANTAYTVDVTITGLGSEDVVTPVEKGNYAASIVVAEWSTGAVLNESL